MAENFNSSDANPTALNQHSDNFSQLFSVDSFRQAFLVENRRISSLNDALLPPLSIETPAEVPASVVTSSFNPAGDAERTFNILSAASGGYGNRSAESVARDLRDTFSTLTRRQISDLERVYLASYGSDLVTDIMGNSALSDDSKTALSILMRGADARTIDDSLKLARLAVDQEDLGMLAEVTRNLSPAERTLLLDGIGPGYLKEVFGSDSDRALHVVLDGKLSTSTLVRDNTSWLGDNESAIELSLVGMTLEERRAYFAGKELAGQPQSRLNRAQITDVGFYDDLHEALVAAGDDTEVAAWEQLILPSTGVEPMRVTQLSSQFQPSDSPRRLLGRLSDAIAGDSGLAARLANPLTTEDRDAAAVLSLYFPKSAMPLELQEAGLGSSLYEAAVQPILDGEHVPFEILALLNTTGDDRVLGDVASATADERARLLNSRSAESVLRNFDEQERQVISTVAIQGEVKPSDLIRYAVVNSDSAQLFSVLKELRPSELDEVRHEYDTKYGDLDAQALSIASPVEKAQLRPLLHPPEDDRARYNYERDAYYISNDGFGRTMESILGGTVILSDQAHNQVSAAIERSNVENKIVDFDNVFDYAEKALSLFQQSKQNNADVLTDAALAATATASTILTFGAGAPLSASILTSAGVGAATNVAGHAMLEGSDFDSREIGALLAEGAVAGGTASVGGAEVGMLQNGLGLRAIRQRAFAEGVAGAGGNAAGSVTEGIANGDGFNTVLANVFESSLVGFVGGSITSGVIDSGRNLFSEFRLRATIEPTAVDSTITVGTEIGFPIRSDVEVQASRRLTELELDSIRASGDENQSVFDRLNQSNLSDDQKNRVLAVLAEVREHYAGISDPTGKQIVDPLQEVNWIHTQGEMGRVLDAGAHNNLTPEDLEKSLLAAMLSDSDKTRSNFFTHHLSGARAAEIILPRYGFGAADIQDVVQAILEHQVGPPAFMSTMYQGAIVRSIDAERASELHTLGLISPEKRSVLQTERFEELRDSEQQFDQKVQRYNQLKTQSSRSASEEARMYLLKTEIDFGKFLTVDERAILQGLTSKIGDPLNAPLTPTPDNRGMRLDLTAQERTLLLRTGNENWFVPDALSAVSDISQSLITGDTIDNYFTPGGLSKILAIRGPDTPFADALVTDSLVSALVSGEDALRLLTPENQMLANAARASTGDAIGRIDAQVEALIRRDKGVGPHEPLVVPFWNVPLKYPVRGLETEEERAAIEYAKTIRAFWVEALRAEQRLGNFTAFLPAATLVESTQVFSQP